MRNSLPWALATLSCVALISCGGGPSTQETGVEAVSTSYVQQDVICCQDYNEEAKVCDSYAIPMPENFTVTITNQVLNENGATQPIQVRGCTAEFYPKNGAPEIEDGYEYVSCTPVTINSGESKEILVSLQTPLVNMMHDYYLDYGETLSYRVKITFDIVGFYSGDYDTSVYVDVDFSNFVKEENDKCTTGG